MGVSLSNRIIFGVPCPRTVFWKNTGEQILVCSVDINHSAPEATNFCVECGAATKTVSIETPAERFSHICTLTKEDPGHVFNALRQDGWEWSSDDEKDIRFKISWGSASSFVSEDCTEVNMIVGIIVDDGSPDEEEKVLSIDPDGLRLRPYRAAMSEVGIALGLVDPPALYFQTHVGF